MKTLHHVDALIELMKEVKAGTTAVSEGAALLCSKLAFTEKDAASILKSL